MPEPFSAAYDGIPGAGPYDSTSRYRDAEVAVHTGPGGEEVRYVKHRLLPPLPSDEDAVRPHVVSEGERPDLLGHRYFGDPAQWWRIADANPVIDPYELTAEPGRHIQIPEDGRG